MCRVSRARTLLLVAMTRPLPVRSTNNGTTDRNLPVFGSSNDGLHGFDFWLLIPRRARTACPLTTLYPFAGTWNAADPDTRNKPRRDLLLNGSSPGHRVPR